MVAGDPVDALGGRGNAPDDVAAADDDRRLDAEGVHVPDLVGEPRDHVRAIPNLWSPINASPDSFRRIRR